MDYIAELELSEVGGRSSGLSHSPFMCHIKFDDKSVESYSVRIYFDNETPWKLGSVKTCKVQFSHFDEFKEELSGVKFHVYEGNMIGMGTFVDGA